MSHSNAYVEAFLTKKPKEGIHIVQGRLKDVMTLDTELAEYFKERAEIEETYAKSLSKASKRLYTTDSSVLGHFAPVWDLLLKEYNQIANYHSELAYKINQHIEKPLRAPPCDDYDKLQQMEPVIQSFESKNKLSSVKGSIFKKPSTKSASWENEGVEYLNLAQGIDEARLNRLKTSVEQFERIQCDQLQKRIDLTYMTLTETRKFDVQHDIRDFCAERGKGLTTIARPQMSNISHDSLRSTTSSSTNKFKSVFMKKKKHSKSDTDEYLPQENYAIMDESFNSGSYSPQHTTIPIAPIINDNNFNTHTHLVDSEGYSVPTTTGQFPTIPSDISSHNTADGVDSDFQSLKLNQKLQINIKDSALNEEASESNESFTKVASMLREHAPTVTRKPRGRRESAMFRSHTDSSLYSMYNNSSNNMNRSSSMLSISSIDTGTSNPFLQQQQQSYSPIKNTFFSGTNSPQPLVESPKITTTENSWLQPIQEDQQQTPEVHIAIHEKVSTTNESHTLLVKGQVSLTYTGPTTAPVLLTASLLHQCIPNPDYITVEKDHYVLNTFNIPQNQPLVCFTYQVESNSEVRPPIQLTPLWKCTDGVTYLYVKHFQTQPVVNTFDGTIHVFYNHVKNVQSIPQGTWNPSENKLTWQMEDLLEQYGKDTVPRLLAKFFVHQQEGISQPIYFSYTVKDIPATEFSVKVMDPSIKQHLETVVQYENMVVI